MVVFQSYEGSQHIKKDPPRELDSKSLEELKLLHRAVTGLIHKAIYAVPLNSDKDIGTTPSNPNILWVQKSGGSEQTSEGLNPYEFGSPVSFILGVGSNQYFITGASSFPEETVISIETHIYNCTGIDLSKVTNNRDIEDYILGQNITIPVHGIHLSKLSLYRSDMGEFAQLQQMEQSYNSGLLFSGDPIDGRLDMIFNLASSKSDQEPVQIGIESIRSNFGADINDSISLVNDFDTKDKKALEQARQFHDLLKSHPDLGLFHMREVLAPILEALTGEKM